MAKKEIKTNKQENKKETKKENKNKKSFFKGLKAELKKVIWPTPKQLFNNTVAVITIVLITALIVFVLDLTFEAINRNGIDKIKESVQSLNSDSNEATNEKEDTNTTEDTNSTDTGNAENTNTSGNAQDSVNTQSENTSNAESQENITE